MPEPSITVNYDIYKRFSEDDKKEWISSCPTRVYRYRQIDGNLDIENWAYVMVVVMVVTIQMHVLQRVCAHW